MSLNLSNLAKGFICALIIAFAVSIPLPEAIAEKEITQGEPLMSKKCLNGLELILQTEKAVYQLKEPIAIRLIVTNKTNEVLKLTFSSTQEYDFVVRKEDKEIWRWSRDKIFAMMLNEIILEPNESLVYEERWNQLDNEGKLVSPGRYEITGILKTHPESIFQPITFKIVEKR
jgi:hypothetical protein